MATPVDLLSILFAPAALVPTLLAVRLASQQQRDARRLSYEVGFGRGLKEAQVAAFLAALSGLATPRLAVLGRDAAVLEVVASAGRVIHVLRLPRTSARYFIAQLRASVPGVEITETQAPLPRMTTARELRRHGADRPFAIPDAAATATTILASASGAGKGTTSVWQVVICGGSPGRAPRPWSQVLADALGARSARSDAKGARAMESTVSTVIRVGTNGSPERLRRLLRASASVAVPGGRLVARWLPERLVTRRLERGMTPLVTASVHLTMAELVALVGWPVASPVVAGLRLGAAPQLAADVAVPRNGRVLGDATVEPKRAVAVSVAASVMHMAAYGPTGSGKSWLAASMALADIEAGRGVCVIDPKGSLVRQIASRLPEHAMGRVLWIDPTDEARPVPLPVLAPDAGDSPELAVDAFIGLLRHRYRDLGPRSSDVLSSSLLTLARVPGASVLDLLRLWSEPGYRAGAVARIGTDPALRSFWGWFEHLSPGERSYMLAAPTNKIRPLLQRSAVRNVTCAPRATFSFTKALRDSRVILVSLPESKLGTEATNLIGSVVLSRLWGAVQQPRRSPFFVTIDEAPRFLDQPTDLGEALALAREWKTGFTLLAQSPGQLPERLREVVSNSARTKVSFQAFARDAVRQAADFGPLVTPDMLATLPEWTAIGQVATGGSVSEPFTFSTRALPDAVPGRLEAVRAASRARYGVPREEIEASFAAAPATGPVAPTGEPETPPEDPGFGPVGRRRKQ